MNQLILKDYKAKEIPEHFEVYNISDEKIENVKNVKLLQLPKLFLMKYKKDKITKKELEEQYFRALDSRGQHLISVNYGSCSIMVCNCETYKHKDTCAMHYLIKYMKKKNHTIDKYE